jgi:type I restriction enzyme, S subunit
MNDIVIRNKKPSIVWISSNFIEDKIGGQYYSTDYIQYERILKKNKLVNLKDVVSEYNGGPMGFQLHSYDYVECGIPVIRTKDMKELSIVINDPIFISEEKHNELKGSRIFPGDILISKTGQIGVVTIVPSTINEANMNQALCNIRVKEQIIDTHFLTVFLNSIYGQYQFIRQGEGKAVQNGLTKEEILALKIPVISPEIQKYIGDKIRKAENLKEEANKLYKSCEQKIKNVLDVNDNELLFNNNAGNESMEFNYHPVINFVNAKDINNRIDPKAYHPELYRTLKKIYRLGIEVVNLKQLLADYSTGKSSPLYSEDGMPILMTKNIRNSYIDWDCKKVSRNSVKKEDLVKKEDVLITTYGGPSIGKVDIKFEEDQCTFDYTILKMNFKKHSNPYFMTVLLRSKFIQNQIRYIIKGTTGITFVIPKEILDIIIPVIDINIQNEIGSLFKKSLNLIEISKNLIQEAVQDVEDLIEGNSDISKI